MEPASPGVPRIDGEWSPWSTLATPCFKPKTGEIVECGGGLQFRYRSCSNPTPRAGGKLCHGKDFKSEACNTHACKCKSHTTRQSLYLCLVHKLSKARQYSQGKARIVPAFSQLQNLFSTSSKGGCQQLTSKVRSALYSILFCTVI